MRIPSGERSLNEPRRRLAAFLSNVARAPVTVPAKRTWESFVTIQGFSGAGGTFGTKAGCAAASGRACTCGLATGRGASAVVNAQGLPSAKEITRIIKKDEFAKFEPRGGVLDGEQLAAKHLRKRNRFIPAGSNG